MTFFSDPATWVLVAFILFVSLALILKAPSMIAKLLDDQIKNIRNELDEARKLKEDANSLLAEYERKIKSTKDETEKIISQAEITAKVYEESTNKKVEEYLIRSEKQSLDRIKQTEKAAIDKISEEIINISINTSEKIISDNMTDENTNQLFSQSLDQIKKLRD
jgi:F-type H+-transporting ATPase subunit b|tara:strand:- start:3112 stop:3603 length:492 start_codon:yes stop_codon:yes gene_type:complete